MTTTMLTPVARAEAGADGRFELPQDGYVQLMPYGEFPVQAEGQAGRRVRLVQVCDRAAAEAMVADFANRAGGAGLLVDYDHGSMDTDKSSEAAAWGQEMAVREDGLYVRNRWTDRGLEAARGGRFLYLSPVFDAATLQDLGGGRVRPTVLLRAALTNDPNLRGIRPLANRSQSPFGSVGTVPAEAGGANTSGLDAAKRKEQAMTEALKKLLGLAPDAADEAVLAGVQALANRAQDRDALATKVATLEQSALETQVERDLDEFAPVIQDRAAAKATLLANRAEGLKLLKALKPAAAAGSAAAGGAAGKQPVGLPNRRTGTIPADGPVEDEKQQRRAAAIRNRAAEIRKTTGCSFPRSWTLAEAECP